MRILTDTSTSFRPSNSSRVVADTCSVEPLGHLKSLTRSYCTSIASSMGCPAHLKVVVGVAPHETNVNDEIINKLRIFMRPPSLFDLNAFFVGYFPIN